MNLIYKEYPNYSLTHAVAGIELNELATSTSRKSFKNELNCNIVHYLKFNSGIFR